MKATLEFNLPEEQEEFETAVKASDYKLALWDIAQEVFRPARKHGYADQKIQTLINIIDGCILESMGDGQATELVSLLEEKFYDILRERKIEL